MDVGVFVSRLSRKSASENQGSADEECDQKTLENGFEVNFLFSRSINTFTVFKSEQLHRRKVGEFALRLAIVNGSGYESADEWSRLNRFDNNNIERRIKQQRRRQIKAKTFDSLLIFKLLTHASIHTNPRRIIRQILSAKKLNLFT